MLEHQKKKKPQTAQSKERKRDRKVVKPTRVMGWCSGGRCVEGVGEAPVSLTCVTELITFSAIQLSCPTIATTTQKKKGGSKLVVTDERKKERDPTKEKNIGGSTRKNTSSTDEKKSASTESSTRASRNQKKLTKKENL